MIRINFENAYKTHSDIERQILIKSWYEILKEYPKEVCDKAVIAAIRTAEFAPKIGTIVKEIEKMQEAMQKTGTELWSELTAVLRQLANNAYKYRFNYIEENGRTQGENAREANKKIFASLSPELKAYYNDLAGLIRLTQLTNDDLNFEKARFLRDLPQLRERAKVKRRLPNEVVGMLGGENINLLEGGK